MSKLFDELSALKEAYDQKLSNEGEAAVKELFKEFFEQNPRAEAISWRQYTPYFNDGDACTFSVHEMYLRLNDEEGEEDDDYDDYYDGYDSYSLCKSEDPELKKLGEAFAKVQSIPDDVLEYVFGDHVKITVTRDGINVQEFDHD